MSFDSRNLDAQSWPDQNGGQRQEQKANVKLLSGEMCRGKNNHRSAEDGDYPNVDLIQAAAIHFLKWEQKGVCIQSHALAMSVPQALLAKSPIKYDLFALDWRHRSAREGHSGGTVSM